MFPLARWRISAAVWSFLLARCVNVLISCEVSIQQLDFILHTNCVVCEVEIVQFQRYEMNTILKIWFSTVFVIPQRQCTNLRLITTTVRKPAAKTEHHRTKQCSFSYHARFALFFFSHQGVIFRSIINRRNCCILLAAKQPCLLQSTCKTFVITNWWKKSTIRRSVSIIYGIFSNEELTKIHPVYYTNAYC